MLLIKNTVIYTGTGEILEDQQILVKDGVFHKISQKVKAPKDCDLIDAEGKIITPGLIDVHTHLGVHEQGVGREGADFNESSDPITPEVRAIDGINPREEGFQDARRSGVTTVQVMPGSGNILGGEMVVMKTAGKIVDEMIIKNPSGMKAALGENPKRQGPGTSGKKPMTRMGIAAKLRAKLMEAEDYLNDKDKNKKRDLGLEQLAKVLRREMPLRVHAHRADDIVTVLRIKEEFDIDITIEHCTEGHFIPDYVADKDVRVSIGPTMSTRSKVELKDKTWETLKVLTDAGVSCSITTDHPVIGIEYLTFSAIEAIKHGLTEQQALRAITLNAAKHIGVSDRVGSIEEGKDADFVIWSGSPFDVRNSVEQVFIDGTNVYS
ncbi:MAG TPA: amidohydrolase [Bacillota bacterium]|nr:amidohydrolase [Bacillota bacterium]